MAKQVTDLNTAAATLYKSLIATPPTTATVKGANTDGRFTAMDAYDRREAMDLLFQQGILK
jgi:hypothetical protein